MTIEEYRVRRPSSGSEDRREDRHEGFASDRAGDMQKIDLGIALCHFELATKEAGMDVQFALCDPEIPAPNYTEYVASWLLSK